jgi:hypothetical protein
MVNNHLNPTLTNEPDKRSKIGVGTHQRNILAFLGAYLYDKKCALQVFPKELIYVILQMILPCIEFKTVTNGRFIHSNDPYQVLSGPAVGGWAATNKLHNFSGLVTFKFEQRGQNAKNFWSCIGISSKNVWTGPGYDWDKNQYEFYYRMDIGAVNGQIEHFPTINNRESPITTISLRLRPGKVKVIGCDKYTLDEKKNREYEIPEEYYIMVDTYYVDTICVISDEYNMKSLNVPSDVPLFSPKYEDDDHYDDQYAVDPVVANPDHMTTLAIAFEWATETQIESALIAANNNVEAAADSLINLGA